jgi:CubicO group peptidase (beta-lactamase class C family)
MTTSRILAFSLAFAVTATGCSGGSSSNSVTAPPPPPPPPPDIWTPVRDLINNNSAIADMTLEVGDDTGTLLVVEKGNINRSSVVSLDSVTKWVSGSVIMTMVEQGKLSLSDTPETYIPFWTSDSSDARSQMTLAQLLNFTAGFPWTPADSLSHPTDPQGCFYSATVTFDQCIQEYYAASASVLQTPVGSTYTYGAAPLQTAGAMALFQNFSTDTGGSQDWDTLFRQQVADPIGLPSSVQYSKVNAINNVPIADGLNMSADQMAVFSKAALTGNGDATFLAALKAMDYDAWDLATPTVSTVFYSPVFASIHEDWHYGRAVWLACHKAQWDDSCAQHHSVYAAGAQGFTTWINRDHNYWAVLSMQQGLDNSGVVSNALQLAEQLESAIATAHP